MAAASWTEEGRFMPDDDELGPSPREIFLAMAEKGMKTEEPVKVLKPLQLAPKSGRM
jgi:hypothetical protein